MTKETQRITWTTDSIKYDGTMSFHYTLHSGVEHIVKLDRIDSAHIHEYIIAICEAQRRKLESADPLPTATSVLLPREPVKSPDNASAIDADFNDEVPF